MCGIWASFGFVEDIPTQLRHAAKIAHRGPDSFRMESIPHFRNCCLAFHRLSIMDDVYGQQPLRTHEFPFLYLIYNGEIYNWKELATKYEIKLTTRLDGEIMLHLYNKFGIKKMSQLLDGVFGFCIVDTEKGEVHIGRDTFGVRPLYYMEQQSGELRICSELKGLKDATDQLSDVKMYHLEPGHIVSYKLFPETGKVKLLDNSRFTDIDIPPMFDNEVTLSEDVKENIRNLLLHAVRKRLMSERRIGCLLSGGLDSSIIAALVVKLCQESGIQYPVQTFSVGLEGSFDLLAARKVAKMLGTEHHEVIYTPEEGFAVLEDVIYSSETYEVQLTRSAIAQYILCKYIREKTDSIVIFSGEGSDELTQGYLYFHNVPSSIESHEESRKMLHLIYYYSALRADRVTAAHGLELRVPFLDKAFTWYYFCLPPELKIPRQGCEKYLLRSAFDGYFKGLLPDEIIWRQKKAFGDGVSSSKNDWGVCLQKHCESLMLDLPPLDVDYTFNPPVDKEAFCYRYIFEKYFRNQSHILPSPWDAMWS